MIKIFILIHKTFHYLHLIRVVAAKIYLKLIYGKRIKLGPTMQFRGGFKIIVSSNAKLTIGDGCFFNFNCTINCLNGITIGEECIFGENVKIYDHNHKFRNTNMPIRLQGYNTKPIIIGKNCWIGSNVTILKGVTIGDNSVIGANCLIYKSVPSNTIVKNKTSDIIEQINLK